MIAAQPLAGSNTVPRCCSSATARPRFDYRWASCSSASGCSSSCPVRPAEGLAVETFERLTLGLVPGPVALFAVARLETTIGVLLLTGWLPRLALALLGVALVGILSLLVLLTGDLFAGPLGAPTLEGQYVLKDVVLAAGALVIAAETLRRRRRRAPDEPHAALAVRVAAWRRSRSCLGCGRATATRKPSRPIRWRCATRARASRTRRSRQARRSPGPTGIRSATTWRSREVRGARCWNRARPTSRRFRIRARSTTCATCIRAWWGG